MFLINPALAAIQLALYPLLLESPRWLLGRDRNSGEARDVIRSLGGMRDDDRLVEAEVDRMMGAPSDMGGRGNGNVNGNSDAEGDERSTRVGGTTATTAMTTSSPPSTRSAGTAAELLSDRKVRRLVVSSLVLQTTQQLSGINAVFYYSSTFFDGVVDDPLVGTASVGIVNVLSTLLALSLMDRFGRRTLILLSTGGMLLCCVALTASFLGALSNRSALVSVNLYVLSFELGLGPIPFLIVPEMFGARYVSTAMSISLLSNWVSNFAVGLAFPFMNESLGPYCFVPFAVALLSSFVYVWIWLPETRGKTHREIEEEVGGELWLG